MRREVMGREGRVEDTSFSAKVAIFPLPQITASNRAPRRVSHFLSFASHRIQIVKVPRKTPTENFIPSQRLILSPSQRNLFTVMTSDRERPAV